jgi:hypothetical protein
MNMQKNQWYKQGWFWLAMTPALGGVFSGVMLVSIALQGADEIIRDDYTKIGMELREDTTRTEAAQRLGLSANVHLLRADGRLIVTLNGLPDASMDLKLRLVHPTDGSRDHEISLAPSAGVYRADLGAAMPGRWLLQLEPTDGSWRLAGELTADASAVALGAESG